MNRVVRTIYRMMLRIVGFGGWMTDFRATGTSLCFGTLAFLTPANFFVQIFLKTHRFWAPLFLWRVAFFSNPRQTTHCQNSHETQCNSYLSNATKNEALLCCIHPRALLFRKQIPPHAWEGDDLT
jgi:hypothetical protein